MEDLASWGIEPSMPRWETDAYLNSSIPVRPIRAANAQTHAISVSGGQVRWAIPETHAIKSNRAGIGYRVGKHSCIVSADRISRVLEIFCESVQIFKKLTK